MKNLEIVKKLALGVFTLACILFVIVPFIGKYELDDQIVKANLKEKADLFIEQSKADPYKSFSNTISFSRALSRRFENFNRHIASQFKIKDEQVSEMIEQSKVNDGYVFKTSYVPTQFGALSKEESEWLNKKFVEYSGWMNERKYDTAGALEKDLKNIINSVGNEAINNQGFSSYAVSGLKQSLVKSSLKGWMKEHLNLLFFLTIGLGLISGLVFILIGIKTKGHPGIKNDHIMFNPMTSVKWLGIMMGTFLISFYVALYWFPEVIAPWVAMVDPVSKMLSGNPASQWFLYGFLYTLAILVMGVRMIIKYRHSPYQIIRTLSVMFFQTAFAFLIPEILVRLNQPYFDFKNMWPLDYDFFDAYNIKNLTQEGGSIGVFMFAWGISLFVIGVPLFTYLFGKRWYCSWVCGCGGLAETLGDPYRQLSNKSMKAWKFERYSIHSVLVFAVVMTGMVLYTFFTGQGEILGVQTGSVRTAYGFMIGSAFSGVIGTGFYPLMGNRVWCRFGCPLAAYLGLVQRFRSKFRITTNGGQCISCGNCSTYCEMGIDVRAYAQKGQNIVRASCVGCGVCSAVCPRGVLNLEVKSGKGRLDPSTLVAQ